MAAVHPYDYAVVRVVPQAARGEGVNVGVILLCAKTSFLDARIELDPVRVSALDPSIDLDAVRETLAKIPLVCAGGAAAGAVGTLSRRDRFRWLVSPRDGLVQPSAVQTGRTVDPAATLDELLNTMVRATGR